MTLDEPKVYSSKSLVVQSSSLLPRDLPPDFLKDLATCETLFKQTLRCLEKKEAETFCQTEILSFNICKNDRDKEIRKRVCEWWQTRSKTMASEERKNVFFDLNVQENDILERLELISDNGQPHVYHRQLRAELDDVREWKKLVSL